MMMAAHNAYSGRAAAWVIKTTLLLLAACVATGMLIHYCAHPARGKNPIVTNVVSCSSKEFDSVCSVIAKNVDATYSGYTVEGRADVGDEIVCSGLKCFPYRIVATEEK